MSLYLLFLRIKGFAEQKGISLSIAGIEGIGVENWLKSHYVPVTGSKYYKIYNNIVSNYISVLKKQEIC